MQYTLQSLGWMAEWLCSGCKAVYAGSFRLQPPNNIMKIGIVGFGFVGQALRKGLEDDVECIVIDPKLKTYIMIYKNLTLIWFLYVSQSYE